MCRVVRPLSQRFNNKCCFSIATPAYLSECTEALAKRDWCVLRTRQIFGRLLLQPVHSVGTCLATAELRRRWGPASIPIPALSRPRPITRLLNSCDHMVRPWSVTVCGCATSVAVTIADGPCGPNSNTCVKGDTLHVLYTPDSDKSEELDSISARRSYVAAEDALAANVSEHCATVPSVSTLPR